MKKPILSICIPTYCRAELAYNCATAVLKYKGDDIELIVVNNASTDNTDELMRTIVDERLKYYTNDTNIGMFKNLQKVIEVASATYVLPISDEDLVLIDVLPKIIEILKANPNLGGLAFNRVLEGRYYGEANKERLYKRGFDTVNKFAFTYNGYQIGFIINKKNLDFEWLEDIRDTHQWIQDSRTMVGDFIAINEVLLKLHVVSGPESVTDTLSSEGFAYFEPHDRINATYPGSLRNLLHLRLSWIQTRYFEAKMFFNYLCSVRAAYFLTDEVFQKWGRKKPLGKFKLFDSTHKMLKSRQRTIGTASAVIRFFEAVMLLILTFLFGVAFVLKFLIRKALKISGIREYIEDVAQ